MLTIFKYFSGFVASSSYVVDWQVISKNIIFGNKDDVRFRQHCRIDRLDSVDSYPVDRSGIGSFWRSTIIFTLNSPR